MAEGAANHVAIVGAGWSAGSVLWHLAERWSAAPPGRVAVTVIDAGGERGGGGPYSQHTDPAYLLNDSATSVDKGGFGFVDWLDRTRGNWHAELVAAAETAPLVRRWLGRNRHHIESGELGRLHVPRRVFGQFAQERYASAVRRLRELGTVTTVTGEVRAIHPNPDATWRLVLGTQRELHADHVVVAVGQTPADDRTDPVLPRAALESLRTTSAAIEASLNTSVPSSPHLVILGSSISACEMLYCVAAADVHERWSITVVGGSGRLPVHPREDLAPCPVILPTGISDADRLTEAILRCFDEAETLGYTGPDANRALKPQISAAFAALPTAERSRYRRLDEARVRRRTRRTSPDYAEAVNRLAARGALRTLPGHAVAARTNGGRIEIGVDQRSELRWIGADRVIDCRGFGQVSHTANPLVRQLIATGIAEPTATGIGLRVDVGLRLAPGLHLLGPLLDGNDRPGVPSGEPIGPVDNLGRLDELGGWTADDIVRAVRQSRSDDRLK